MSLQVITGCMFSGKTTELLRLYRESEEAKVLVNHSKDSRYSAHSDVTSHDLNTERSLALENLETLRREAVYVSASRIFIDEAQFFSNLYDTVKLMVDEDRKHVVVAGLNGDYMRRVFGQISMLLPIADSVSILHARCFQCDKSALFTHRKEPSGSAVNVGGALKYVSLCRDHYLNAIPNTILSETS